MLNVLGGEILDGAVTADRIVRTKPCRNVGDVICSTEEFSGL